MATPLQIDDNLTNGITYTFQLKCTNLLILPSATTVQTDITNNAPSFCTSLQVTSPFSTSLYNVQFTYEGDGSDVVSDVANSMVAAVQAGSNDDMVFIGAVSGAASLITVSIPNAIASTEQAVSDATNKVATDATKAATNTVNTALVGLLPLLLVVVAVILFVLPSLMKSTGTRASIG